MKKLCTFLLLLLSLCAVNAASTRVAVILTFNPTNAPVNSNAFVLNGVTWQWRTNATSLTAHIPITNSLGGNVTNFFQRINGHAFTGNVEIAYGAASNVIVLQGQVNRAMVATLSGSWATITTKTNPASVSELVMMPFTEEGTNSRKSIASGMVTAIKDHATNEFPASAPSFRQFVNTSTNRQTLTNKAGVNFDMISGRIGSAEVTNLDFYPKWTIGDREDIGGSGGAELTFNSYDGASWLTIKPNAFTGVPMLMSSTGDFYDVIDNATEGLETNSSLINIGTFWRWSPKLSSLGSLPFEYTNQWTTFQYYTNAYGAGAFTTYAVGYDVYHQGRLFASGGGTLTNLDTVTATNGRFANLSGTNVTLQGGTFSGGALDSVAATNLSTRKALFIGGSMIYGLTNFTSLANGNNIAVEFGTNTFVRISGTLTADGAICGVAGGVIGKTYMLWNDTTYNITLTQSTADPIPGNCFANYGNLDMTIPPQGFGSIVYKGTRWTTAWTFPSLVYATNAAAVYNFFSGQFDYPGGTNIYLKPGLGVTNLNVRGGLSFAESTSSNKLSQIGTTLVLSNSVNGEVLSYDDDADDFSLNVSSFSLGYVTPSTVAVFDDANGLVSGDATAIEVGYLSGARSNIQSQIDWVRTNALGNTDFDSIHAGSLIVSNLAANSLLYVNSTGLVSTVTMGPGVTFTNGVLSATGGGAGGLGSSNVIISATNEVFLNWANASEFRVFLLTNANITFTNTLSLSNLHGYVYLQQDTNGGRTVTFRNAQGLIQTNASMVVTTNANALDLLEVKQSFFPTNLLAWWPQNLQPRVAFTNSLASSGGGGGGSTNDPTSVSNLVFWLDVDQLSGSDGDGIATFTDHSGNSHNFTQSTSGNRALLTNSTSGFNGKKTLWFDGVNDSYANTDYSTVAGNYTFFFVMQMKEDFGGFANRWLLDSSSSGSLSIRAIDTGSYKLAVYDVAGSRVFENPGIAPLVVSVVCNSTGTNLKVYTNGVQMASATAWQQPAAGETLTVGGSASGGAFYNGILGDCLTYTGALSDANRKTVEQYLGTKFGITVAP
jgi:hypothetical protein